MASGPEVLLYGPEEIMDLTMMITGYYGFLRWWWTSGYWALGRSNLRPKFAMAQILVAFLMPTRTGRLKNTEGTGCMLGIQPMIWLVFLKLPGRHFLLLPMNHRPPCPAIRFKLQTLDGACGLKHQLLASVSAAVNTWTWTYLWKRFWIK